MTSLVEQPVSPPFEELYDKMHEESCYQDDFNPVELPYKQRSHKSSTSRANALDRNASLHEKTSKSPRQKVSRVDSRRAFVLEIEKPLRSPPEAPILGASKKPKVYSRPPKKGSSIGRRPRSFSG
jgi:hypothetical protein